MNDKIFTTKTLAAVPAAYPFAIRSGEKAEVFEVNFCKTYISAQNVTENERLVLRSVADNLVATSLMVSLDTGIDVITVRKVLKRLYLGGYIKKGQFSTDDGRKSAFCFYFIRGGRGNTLHYQLFGRSATKYSLVNNYTSPEQFKRVLAVNQYLLTMKNIGSTITSIKRFTVIENRSPVLGKTIAVRPGALVSFADRKPILTECVRSTSDSADLRDKLERYKKLMRGKTSVYEETLGRDFTLVLLCESRAHIERIKDEFGDILRSFPDITFISDADTLPNRFGNDRHAA